jgi:predicted nucleotidyltransferase
VRTKLSIEKIKNKILPILKKYGISRASIFGSVVTGEAREDSDVDILVEIGRDDISLLDFVKIELELGEVPGRKVYLIEYCTIHPRLKERILKEEVRVL